MSDPYERYLADFGERIEGAASPPSRSRPRWVLAAAVLAGAAIALVAVLAAPAVTARSTSSPRRARRYRVAPGKGNCCTSRA